MGCGGRLRSMRSLRLNELDDKSLYCLDLVQRDDASRFVHIRATTALAHPETALSSIPLLGSLVIDFMIGLRMDERVVTEEGDMIGLSAHYWMLEKEARYLAETRRLQAHPPGAAPWVNGKPPLPAT